MSKTMTKPCYEKRLNARKKLREITGETTNAKARTSLVAEAIAELFGYPNERAKEESK